MAESGVPYPTAETMPMPMPMPQTQTQPGWNEQPMSQPPPPFTQQPVPPPPFPQQSMPPPPPFPQQQMPPPYYAVPPPPPGHSHQQTVVVTSVETVPLVINVWSVAPMRVTCSKCRSDVVTETKYVLGAFAWCMMLVFLLFCICLTCLPCCVKGFKDVEHRCPNCRAYLGRHSACC